jgi:hypothetical protein
MKPGQGAEVHRKPKLAGTWMTLQQAELMLIHVEEAGNSWPDGALYLHSCITAVRSITLTMQHELAHEPGFQDWYSEQQQKLASDPELVYLKEARNHVLKRGNLQLMASHSFSYDGSLGISIRGFGPNGPDVWIANPEVPDEEIPIDWRKLDGFKFEVPLRFAKTEDLPNPPDREVKELLKEKLGRFRLLILEAEERFDPEHFDVQEATEQRKHLSEISAISKRRRQGRRVGGGPDATD